MARHRRTAAAIAAASLLAALAACAQDDPGPAESTDPEGRSASAQEYRPGRSAVLERPAGEPAAVVVLVPGGGWASADPGGFDSLASALVGSGLAVVTITYGTSGTGDRYPTPVLDVACAASYAAAQVPDLPVVLVGHSAGAHLAALAALQPPGTPDAPEDDECSSPPHPADAVVGLAGPYDLAEVDFAVELFGASRDEEPTLWTEGNPVTWAQERPEVPFLLVHGDADSVVPTSFSTSFGQVLREGGHDVVVEILPGVDHGDVFQGDVVGDLLVRWVEDEVLSGPGAARP